MGTKTGEALLWPIKLGFTSVRHAGGLALRAGIKGFETFDGGAQKAKRLGSKALQIGPLDTKALARNLETGHFLATMKDCQESEMIAGPDPKIDARRRSALEQHGLFLVSTGTYVSQHAAESILLGMKHYGTEVEIYEHVAANLRIDVAELEVAHMSMVATASSPRPDLEY